MSSIAKPAAKRSRGEITMDPADERAINTIRCLAADTVQKANSGHPGAPMGCAPMAHVLWSSVMRYNPKNPAWPARDRFVLSNGHACALQYCMLHLTGYDLSIEDLKQFRQLHSKTPGHPEVHVTPGVEVCTGPLGQGITNAVGLALSEAHLAATFNKEGHKLVDNFTYVICGDGCLQEGISSEASSLAGHLGLGKLIVLYDDNHITIDGSTDLSFTEDVLARYAAYGWHTQHVPSGDADLAGLAAAIEAAKAETGRPSIIKVTTVIGFGSKNQGKEKVHGAPLGDEDISAIKTKFGFDPEEKFAVGDDVYAHYRGCGERGTAAEAEWNALFASYASAYPAEAAEFTRRMSGGLPDGWKDKLPTFPAGTKKATREHSETVINAIAGALPELMGGSADLTPSNKTLIKISHDFQKATPEGRYIRFGVREHAMAAVCNGMAAYGGLMPYCATFLNFCGYALGAVRLSALSDFRVLYVFTHDSIGLGEDGPTHQPIAMLNSLRAMPNMYVYRPADGTETSGCYAAAIEHKDKPAALALSRQGLPELEASSIENVAKGGYVCLETGESKAGADPDVVFIATGSEVEIAMNAAKMLDGVRARVVSMPCMELFLEQSAEYRASILPDSVPTVSVEAAALQGWEKFAHLNIGMTHFGASAPIKDVYADNGITPEAIAARVGKMLTYYASNPVPSLARPEF